MIQTDYVLLLARYNAWQNNQLRDALTGVDDAVLTTDRGAFFGTILRTLSHLLWGDAIWRAGSLMPSAPPMYRGRRALVIHRQAPTGRCDAS